MPHRLAWPALCLSLLLTPLLAAEPAVSLTWDAKLNRHRFRVAPLTEQQHAALEVQVVVVPREASEVDQQPLLRGEWKREGDAAYFDPAYPPTPGVTYRVRTRLHPRDPFTVTDLTVPRENRAPTRVSAVYPTAAKLPENQLKFYLHFSGPMSRGEAYDHLQLLDEDGKPVPQAFLELGEELWDREQTRFTLLFDPGRIKRGLKPREDLGPVLEEGRRYTLVVSSKWADAKGQPLAEAFRKSFQVTAPLGKQLRVADWRWTHPARGQEPVQVRFPRPLDHALLQRMLVVVDAAGKPVAGSIQTTQEETQWSFTPAQPWAAGDYRVRVDTRLEDLAGNSIAKPFEAEESEEVKKSLESGWVEVPFTIRP